MDELMEIRIELLRHRITQRRLALHLGVSDSYLSDVLNSIKPVGRDLIEEIRRGITELAKSKRR